MKSHEALSLCIGRHASSIAKALHLSTSLVHKWQEPCGDWSDSGAHNPLDRISVMVRRSIELGQGAAAYEPIRWLCECFGMTAVRLPTPLQAGGENLTAAVVNLSAELGDVARSVAEASADGQISSIERRRIEAELTDMLRASQSMLHTVRAHD